MTKKPIKNIAASVRQRLLNNAKQTNRIDIAPDNLEEVVKAIKGFIKPITLALAAKKTFDRLWKAPGPWR